MGTTIFAEMSALAVATGSINLGQGFPDTDGPPAVAEAAAAAVLAGPGQPVPARPRHPRAARGRSPTTSSRFYGLRLRPGHRGAGHRRRDRGDRRGDARPARAGRRGDRVRALLRLLRGRSIAHGRRDPACRSRCGRAGVPARPGRAARPRSPAGPGCCCSTRPHNPTGMVFTRGRARARIAADRASSTTCSSSPTRCTSTWSSTGGARPDRHAARACASARSSISSARQDVLVHRLEDRLGHRPRRSWSPRSGRPSSS